MSSKLYATMCIRDQVWNPDLINSSSQGHKTMYQQKDFQIYQIFIMPVYTYISEYYY